MLDKINYEEMLGKAQELQKKMLQEQEKRSKQIYESTVGGGMIKVEMNGQFELLSLKIEAAAIDPQDPEMLEDMIRSAINECLREVKKASSADSSISSLFNNFDLSQLKNMLDK